MGLLHNYHYKTLTFFNAYHMYIRMYVCMYVNCSLMIYVNKNIQGTAYVRMYACTYLHRYANIQILFDVLNITIKVVTKYFNMNFAITNFCYQHSCQVQK